MPTKREEDAAIAAHRAQGRPEAIPGWYADPDVRFREWHWDGSRWTGKHRKVPSAAAGWYPDPKEDSREWHWDGSTWTGRFRSQVKKKNNFASAYNLLPTWAQVVLPIVVLIAVLALIGAAGERNENPEPTPIERFHERTPEEQLLEELSSPA